MASQERCKRAMQDVAEAVNRMFAVPLPGSPGYDPDEAIAEGRRIAEKIRAEREREGRLPEKPKRR